MADLDRAMRAADRLRELEISGAGISEISNIFAKLRVKDRSRGNSARPARRADERRTRPLERFTKSFALFVNAVSSQLSAISKTRRADSRKWKPKAGAC